MGWLHDQPHERRWVLVVIGHLLVLPSHLRRSPATPSTAACRTMSASSGRSSRRRLRRWQRQRRCLQTSEARPCRNRPAARALPGLVSLLRRERETERFMHLSLDQSSLFRMCKCASQTERASAVTTVLKHAAGSALLAPPPAQLRLLQAQNASLLLLCDQ